MYEDGSSCDEDFWNNKADAEGEYRQEREWRIEKIVREHLSYHNEKYGTKFSEWSKEDVLADLSFKIDKLFCDDQDDFYFEDDEVEDLIEKVILNQEAYK